MIWLLESDVMDRRRDLQEQRHRDLDISETRAKTFIEEAKRRLNASLGINLHENTVRHHPLLLAKGKERNNG